MTQNRTRKKIKKLSNFNQNCELGSEALPESDWMPWMASPMTRKSCLERAGSASLPSSRPMKRAGSASLPSSRPTQKTFYGKIQSSGFTLIEILVALFIFTIVAIIMSQSLHTIFTTQSVTETRATKLSELQLATLLFSRDIEQTINRQITNAKNQPEIAFIGTPTTLTFTHGGLANPTGEIQRSTLQRSNYFLEKNNFIRQIWNALDQAQTSKPLQRTILTEVSELHFEYLDEKGLMHSSWPPTDLTKALPIPRAVRITLTLTNWGKISLLYPLTAPTEAPTNA